MRKGILLALLLSVTGCSVIVDKVLDKAKPDLQLTADMANEFGKPEVQKCASFLVSAIDGLDADQASIDKLRAIETNGIFSSAFKAYLIKEHLASLNDPARADAFKKAFDSNCRAVAGQILLDLVRDAAKFGKRG